MRHRWQGRLLPDQFTLHTEQLGALPIINSFLDRLGLDRLLAQFLPSGDARTKLAPASVPPF